MPHKKVEIFRRGGGSSEASECPLGKFRVDEGGGSYTNDPLEACLDCNFLGEEGTELEKRCQCPEDLTWPEYDRLKRLYTESTTDILTKRGFQEFVRENYP